MSWISLIAPCVSHAVDNNGEQTPPIQSLDELVVYGDGVYCNHEDITSPVLSYDLNCFQRFEPITVGDALKRVPGVTLTSDIGEFYAPQFRGLPSGVPQVPING